MGGPEGATEGRETLVSRKNPVASAEFNAYYDEFYGEEVSAQRDAAAPRKAGNIASSWQALGLSARPNVVDIGCGDGAVAQQLGAEGFFRHLDGFDVSSSGIGAARTREIPDTSFATFDGVSLPCSDNAYDLAVLSHVIEHVAHPRQLLYEAKRVANWVLVEVPLEHHRRTPREFRWTDVGHINFYDDTTIRLLLQTVGLDVAYEEIFCPNKDVFIADTGSVARGTVLFLVKSLLFRMSPRMAKQLVTYWCVLLARSDSDVIDVRDEALGMP